MQPDLVEHSPEIDEATDKSVGTAKTGDFRHEQLR
jgi:hypothetical protein